MAARVSTTPKTVYISYMCDHCYPLAAALRFDGTPAVALPPTTDEDMAVGMEVCRGHECSPCFTSNGSYVRLVRQPDFDPDNSVLFMPTTTGSCRFGQYMVLQRQILDDMGLHNLEIIAPSAKNSYHGFGKNPTRLRQLIWQGLVAVDLLQKLLHEYRPYETVPGAVDRAYAAALERIVAGTEAGGGKHLVAAMEATAALFEQLPVDRSVQRPIIGIVGEIYLRFNGYSNLEIIRKVEAAGGEALLATMMEWFYYTNWNCQSFAWFLGQPLEWAQMTLTDLYQRHLEHRLLKPVAHLLKFPHETPVSRLIDNIRPFYAPELGNECVLTMGKAIDMAQMGVSGIINVMPFSCMPGIITSGMAPRIRADLDNLPWLDIAFDAQGGTNITTRLEAFMYQATEFLRRHPLTAHGRHA